MLCFSFDFWSTYADCILDRIALCQADPKKSPELRELVTEVVNKETTALLREITTVKLELEHLQKERFEIMNKHAAEIQALHLKHASDLIQTLGSAVTPIVPGTPTDWSALPRH